MLELDPPIARNFAEYFSEVKFPIITVYFSPEDFPGMFVARLFDTEKPTKYYAIKNSLDEIRELKPSEMVIFPRSYNDVLSIVEAWI